MTKIRIHLFFLALLIPVAPSLAQDASGAKSAPTVCLITGNPAKSEFASKYEGKTYTFCSKACIEKFKQARAASLYEKIGGQAALKAAVASFYKKVLADKRVNHFFEDVNMRRQHNQQQAFISAALGGPEPWRGRDLRKAHASLELTEKEFGIIAVHLQKTLEELKVPKDLIGQVMTIVGSTKDAVLNRDPDSK